MRLIDADKLFIYLKNDGGWQDKYPVTDGKQYDTMMIYEIKDEIDDAETVDAIPVSVLKEWQKQYSNKVTFGHIMKLVDEWRKENESNDM